MHYFRHWLINAILLLTLAACGSDEPTVNDDTQVPKSTDAGRITIGFTEGPNQGEHVYQVDPMAERGTLKLRFNQDNRVLLLEARGLVSQDREHTIDELRRMMAGDAVVGDLQATSWLGDSSFSNGSCGNLALRDHTNSKEFSAAFGSYVNCGAVALSKVGPWQKDNQGRYERRWVEGNFTDHVRLQVTNDARPFQKLESEILVDFALWQERVPER